MSSKFRYTAGIGNVGSYQVAGSPYLTASNIVEQEKVFEFPTVTKKVTVHNTGSNSVNLYFKESSLDHLILPSNKKIVMDVKCTKLFVSGSTATGIQMFAELTSIGTGSMYSFTGLEGI